MLGLRELFTYLRDLRAYLRTHSLTHEVRGLRELFPTHAERPHAGRASVSVVSVALSCLWSELTSAQLAALRQRIDNEGRGNLTFDSLLAFLSRHSSHRISQLDERGEDDANTFVPQVDTHTRMPMYACPCMHAHVCIHGGTQSHSYRCSISIRVHRSWARSLARVSSTFQGQGWGEG